ncbi:hypothetical protein [Anaerocolumna jejuensis]|uniref:hypothetical protein n=1 Tax=Anaerocolumna jejuensis TaxID=259063 RepID=UPI003F7B570C
MLARLIVLAWLELSLMTASNLFFSSAFSAIWYIFLICRLTGTNGDATIQFFFDNPNIEIKLVFGNIYIKNIKMEISEGYSVKVNDGTKAILL